MRNLFKLTFDKVFFSAFFVLIVLTVFGTISNSELIWKLILPLTIPVFLIFFFVQKKYLNIAFISFLIFSFLGDLSSIFFTGTAYVKISSILYFLGYLYLIGMILPNFKILRLDKIITIYLITVFSISIYFLYTLYNMLNLVISDGSEVLIFAVKNLVLIILSFIAFGVYLSNQSKSSVIFLVAIICVVFSTLMRYINLYYIYHWSFEMLGGMLYVSGLYFMFRYMIIQRKIKKIIVEKTGYASNNILIKQ